MTFSESITACMSKYATFTGRASRSEYWWFYLFALALSWGASIVGASQDITWLSLFVSFALIVPQIAVGTRRLHDIGKSGWRQLLMLTIIGIIPVVFWLAKEGASDENEYGQAASA